MFSIATACKAGNADAAKLRASGVQVYYEEDRRDGVIEGPRAYFQDPDGNTLEIIDLTFYAGASPTKT
ncbi:MAG TPA: VOC family protein [Steroidobacteraceae bacterium]|jgi:catechol 2,3-dioxygenase-like lactoylglutathione lyase family enzyme